MTSKKKKKELECEITQFFSLFHFTSISYLTVYDFFIFLLSHLCSFSLPY